MSKRLQVTALALVFQQAILSRDVAVDHDLIPSLGVTDIIDRHIVVLAPEERHLGVSIGGNRVAIDLTPIPVTNK